MCGTNSSVPDPRSNSDQPAKVGGSRGPVLTDSRGLADHLRPGISGAVTVVISHFLRNANKDVTIADIAGGDSVRHDDCLWAISYAVPGKSDPVRDW